MLLTGIWAAVEPCNCNLDIYDDGTMTVTVGDAGIYFLTPETYSAADNKVIFSHPAENLSGDLSADGDGNLTGWMTMCGKTFLGQLNWKSDRTERGEFAKTEPGASGIAPEGFKRFTGGADVYGKWNTNAVYGNMNVHISPDGEGAKLALSFDGSRFTPYAVFMNGDTLIFRINDAENRGIGRLKCADGVISGTYTQLGHQPFKPFTMKRISLDPEEMPEYYVDGSETRIELLRKFAAYETPETPDKPGNSVFILGGKLPSALKEAGFEKYISGKTGDAAAFACLDFVCDNYKHNGDSGMPSKRGAADIIAYCRENDMKINCRGLAILLAAALRYAGIRAQHVTCMPYEEPFVDCHVVVDCFLPESGKRVMLDPTYRLWLMDAAGEYVALPQLRDILLAGGTLVASPTAGYNGGGFDLENYREYMTKNTFRFKKGKTNKDGFDEADRMSLLPSGYDPKLTGNEIFRDAFAFWN